MALRSEVDVRLTDRAVAERTVVRLLTLVKNKGADANAVLAAAGVRQTYVEFVSEGNAAVSFDELRAVSAFASVAASNIQAKLVGRGPFRSSDWRVLFYCLTSSRTLREAITRAAEVFASVDGRLGSLVLTVRDGFARITMDGLQGPDPELAFFVVLQGHRMFNEIFEWLIGTPLEATAHLEFGENMRVLADEAVLPFPLVMNDSNPGLVFPAFYLDHPVIRSTEDCEALPTLNFLIGAGVQNEAEVIAERARQITYRMLKESSRLPSLDMLAAILRMSRMTFRRRLASAGTSLNQIRDASRRQLGLDLLRRTSLPIEEVAVRLDYCDSDALRVAVRDWVGMSPTEYRRHAGPQSGDDQLG